jgi:hypothetical protein
MAAGGGGEGGGRPGRHLLRGGIMDHHQTFFYVRRAAKLTLPPAPETLAPPLGGRGRKRKGCPPKQKSWRRHWSQWPKANREGDFLPFDTEIRHVVGRSELLFTRKGRSFELSYVRTGAALAMGSKGPDPQPRPGRPARFVQIRRLRWG